MTPTEFKEAVRNMRYWQKRNKVTQSSISFKRLRSWEAIVDNYLESH